MKRTRVAVVTSARADYGIYLPLLRALRDAGDFELSLLVTGMHLAPEFGLTVRTIEEDGFPIGARFECLETADDPAGIARSMGRGVAGFAEVFARALPDLLVVLGDRFEMHAAALAALPFNLPVAHIHGGELTRGAMDESLRHSLTKLSHLHFVTTEEYRRRVIQLGEGPERVTCCGAPSLDNLCQVELLEPEEIETRFGVRPTPETLLVTYHPVTLEYTAAADQIDALLAALEGSGRPLLFTLGNADTGGRLLNRKVREFARGFPRAAVVETLGTQGYFSVMNSVAAMVGNSSSGIIEAASFALPVVNVGIRQQGRAHGRNVIDCGNGRAEIAAAIARACDPVFRAELQRMENPYGCGEAAQIILAKLRAVDDFRGLILKPFYDLPTTESSQ